MRTKNPSQNDFKLKNEVFMSKWKLQFYANYFFDPKTYMQSHILGRWACQMSLEQLLLQLAKGWRYTTPLKMENSIENANFEQV